MVTLKVTESLGLFRRPIWTQISRIISQLREKDSYVSELAVKKRVLCHVCICISCCYNVPQP
jgi:hypothetical protein